jgi:hypothetical protein
MSDYGDQVTLGRLYEKVSKKSGNTYLVGRLGMAKIAILKSKDTSDNGDAIWNIVISEGQNDKRQGRAEQGTDTQSPSKATSAPGGHFEAISGDEIPFAPERR